MAHGVDTDELLRRIANIQDGILNLNGLNITSLPELPHNLITLICYDCPLRNLPDLPSELINLACHRTNITTLPNLPSKLKHLVCAQTNLTSLPDLPSGLVALQCNNTQITVLPELPSSLTCLWCVDTPLILERRISEAYIYESIPEYSARWKLWREEQEASKKRCQERTEAVKEDLIASVWHPRRVEKWLEVGGFELLEAL